MDRRNFVRLAGMNVMAGALNRVPTSCRAAAVESDTPEREASTPRKALMKVGHQHQSSDEILRLLAAFGVNHMCW